MPLSLYCVLDKPSISGIFIFMEHWENLSLEDINGETWSDVLFYEGLYKISSYGRVKSLKRKTSQGKLLIESIKKPVYDKDGYKFVVLCKNGVVSSKRVHRMVCESFYGINKNKPIVNHINGVKYDNRVDNLEWCTRSENQLHAYRTGLQVSLLKGKTGASSLFSKKVAKMNLSGEIIQIYDGVRDAGRVTGINRCSIGQACKGNYITAGGYKWKYL